MKKMLSAAVFAGALIPTMALAQMAPEPAAPATAPAASDTMNDMSPDAATPAMGSAEMFVVPAAGSHRVSQLQGLDVYSAQDEDIGEISDVLVDDQGMVTGVLVSVGGFLGMGQKEVAVPMSALQFTADAEVAVDAPAATTSPTAGEAPAAAVTSTGDVDRVVLAATREELEAAPAYEDDATR